ncbi:MAG: VWA domain-containing protein [Bacteriovoracaceae bacterium]
MNFLNKSYLFPIIVFCLFFVIITLRQSSRFDAVMKKYWFIKASPWKKISRLFYVLGFCLLCFSLLDFRGRPEKVESSVSDQKTIIIIDSSASMLVEDVRPNRFQKALMLARHFVKSSAGHQLAVVVFSDTQKRLIPFTDDIDLLDARIAALEKLRINYGGSNIIQAIQESIQYFKTDKESIKNPKGNILVFTDSEDNGTIQDLNVPEGVNLAMVGVGSRSGGRIPIRNKDGNLYGYKKFKGKEVISKLDEESLKKIGTSVKSFKYWVALSYSVPTDEILSFFRGIHQNNLKKGTTTIRPVIGHRVVITGIVLFILSSLFNLARDKVIAGLLLFFLVLPGPRASAQDDVKPEDLLDEQTLEKLAKFKQGKMDSREKLSLAQDLIQKERVEEGVTLYEDVLSYKKDLSEKAKLNLGTAYLKLGKIKRGLDVYDGIDRKALSQDEEDLLAKNTVMAFKQQKQKQKQKQQQQKNQKQQNQDQQDQDGQSGENQDQQKTQKNQSGDPKEPKDQKGDEKDKKKNNDSKDSDKGEKKEKKKPQSIKEREEEIRKQRKMVKIPAILKQIMNDDRKLQQKYWKTSTKNRNRDKKDW